MSIAAATTTGCGGCSPSTSTPLNIPSCGTSWSTPTSSPYYDAAAPQDVPALDGKVAVSRPGQSLPVEELRRRMDVSKENMRRFIKAGAKFSMGTDTGAFLNFQQEDPNASELMLMVEMGMDPLRAIQAGTHNGAEALGLLRELGTIEKGKLADVIVVAGNPLQDMAAMKRVAYVAKGGVRYK